MSAPPSVKGVQWRRPAAVMVEATGLLIALAVAVWNLSVTVGAFVPSAGQLGVLASVAVPAYGPTLVIVALVMAVLGAVIAWCSPRRRHVVASVAALAGASGVALAVVVGLFVTATENKGGSLSLWRAVVPTSEAPPTVRERPVFSIGIDGQPLHLTVERPAVGPDRSAPIMVWVHGGGWIGGSDLSRASDMRRFADRGWLAVSVEYSLAGPGRPTWDVAGPEVACALTHIGAGALGGDPSRMVLGGDSAGGQLAVSVAYHAAIGDQTSSCGGLVPVPRAVATNYPAVDLVAGYDHGARSSQPSLDARTLAVGYTGGSPAQVPDRYRAVSGAAAATAAAPQTLVVAPSQDALVPPASLAGFAAVARRAGVDVTVAPLPFVNHAYDTLGAGSLGQQAGFSIIESWSRQHVGLPD